MSKIKSITALAFSLALVGATASFAEEMKEGAMEHKEEAAEHKEEAAEHHEGHEHHKGHKHHKKAE